MYILASVHSGKCTFEEMSIRPNVHSGKCPFWKMYIWDNVHSAKWFLGKSPFWKVFFGEMYKILEMLLGNARKFAEKLRRPFLFSSIGDSLKKVLKTFFLRSPEKNFEDFFFENTCTCLLGCWPWPPAFLSLASRGSVLGRAVLGLSLGFFCVLGLEPSVLDSTSDN